MRFAAVLTVFSTLFFLGASAAPVVADLEQRTEAPCERSGSGGLLNDLSLLSGNEVGSPNVEGSGNGNGNSNGNPADFLNGNGNPAATGNGNGNGNPSAKGNGNGSATGLKLSGALGGLLGSA